MKSHLPPNIEKVRVKHGPLASTSECGFNGAFWIPYCEYEMFVVVSDGMGWDHVSVSHNLRCPTWKEMCFVKRLFFGPEETVIQYHPPESKYINAHPYALHMWRKQGSAFELPPPFMV